MSVCRYSVKTGFSLHFHPDYVGLYGYSIGGRSRVIPVECVTKPTFGAHAEMPPFVLRCPVQEEKFQKTSEAINSRVVWFSVLQLLLLCACTLVSIFYLVRYFHAHKII